MTSSYTYMNFGAKLKAWRHMMFYLFHFFKSSDMAFKNPY